MRVETRDFTRPSIDLRIKMDWVKLIAVSTVNALHIYIPNIHHTVAAISAYAISNFPSFILINKDYLLRIYSTNILSNNFKQILIKERA